MIECNCEVCQRLAAMLPGYPACQPAPAAPAPEPCDCSTCHYAEEGAAPEGAGERHCADCGEPGATATPLGLLHRSPESCVAALKARLVTAERELDEARAPKPVTQEVAALRARLAEVERERDEARAALTRAELACYRVRDRGEMSEEAFDALHNSEAEACAIEVRRALAQRGEENK